MAPALPLSDLQQSMLVQEALVDRPLYTMPLCFVIRGTVDADALEAALHHVLGRHPVLHCTYGDRGAVPHADRARWPGLDRRTGSEADAAAWLDRLWALPFDLSGELPVRATLVSGPAGDVHRLGLSLHHVAGDSWSLAMVLRELGLAYRALLAGDGPPRAPAAPDFFDYAAWEQDQDWDTGWWREVLREAAPVPLPPPEMVAEDRRGTFTAVELGLDAADTRQVRAAARTGHASPAVVVLTAVSATVAGTGGSTVGLPVVLRDTAERQDTVGPLLNTLPVRTTWPADPAAGPLLAAHAAALDAALAHKQVPYPRILRASRAGRASAAPPFLHVVNVDTSAAALRLPVPGATTVPVAPRWANFPALWEFGWGAVGNIHGTLRASADHFTAGQAQDLADEFHGTLRRLLSDLHRPTKGPS